MCTIKLFAFMRAVARAATFRAHQEPAAVWRQKRREHRVVSQRRVLTQVRCSPEAALVGMSASCETINISQKGLKLSTSQGLPVSSRLDLWLDIEGKKGAFLLSSDVIWCQRIARDLFEVGLALQDGDKTDIDQWLSQLQYESA